MFTEIKAGYEGAKAALDIAKGIHALKTDAEKNQAVIDLQRHILDAQSALFAANEAQSAQQQRIRLLETEITELRNWDVDADRYQLEDTGQGTLAYKLRDDAAHGEPDHWLCPTCFARKQKSILKMETYAVGRTSVLKCHPCGMEIITRGLKQTALR